MYASLQNENGDTPLHVACIHNRPKIMKMLLRHGAGTRAQNADGDTPLHVACKKSYFRCVKILFESKCYSIQNSAGDTPLHLACSNGSYACVTLLSSGSLCVKNNTLETPLHIACRLRSFSILYHLLNCKDFTDISDASSVLNRNGELPVHIALKSLGKWPIDSIRLCSLFQLARLTPILHEHHELMALACQCKTSQSPKVVQYFRKRGVKIDVTVSEKHKLPIHYASSRSLELVKLFCVSPSIINSQDLDGNTALHIAASNSKYDICKYLIQDKKCDISIRNKKKELALHNACNVPSMRSDIICLLLLKEDRALSLVSDPDSVGNYPFHYLCKNFANDLFEVFSKMFDVLCKTGRCSHPNKFGELPIHFLCKSKAMGALKAVEIIIPHTKDLNTKTLSGETPLHLACLSERHDIIQLIAKQRQCSITSLNANNDLPLHLACQMRILCNSDQLLTSEAMFSHDFKNKLDTAVEESYCFISTIQCLSTTNTVNACNDNGDTPLHMLLKNHYLEYVTYICNVDKLYCEILRSLLSFGALTDHSNNLNEFPIHLACQYQILEPIKLIGMHGISESTSKSENVFHAACRNVTLTCEIFSYLEGALGDVDKTSLLHQRNENGDTPLHVYCMADHYFNENCIKFLLKNSDINSKNNEGNTPFHLLLNTCYYNEESILKFIHDEKYDYTLSNKKDETVLSFITRDNRIELAKEIVVFHSPPSRAHKLKQILSLASENLILKLFLSGPDIIRILADFDVNPAPLFKAQEAFFVNRQKPLQVPINMLLLVIQ